VKSGEKGLVEKVDSLEVLRLGEAWRERDIVQASLVGQHLVANIGG
jgi:hypothetical protein